MNRIKVKVPFRLAVGMKPRLIRAGVYEISDDPDYITTVSQDDAAYLITQRLAEPVKTKRAPQNKKIDVENNK